MAYRGSRWRGDRGSEKLVLISLAVGFGIASIFYLNYIEMLKRERDGAHNELEWVKENVLSHEQRETVKDFELDAPPPDDERGVPP